MRSANGADMAKLVGAKDWSRTPLGPIERWPRRLRTLVDMIEVHPVPMVVWWGPDLIQIYNEGYAQIAGGKHPAGLGQPARECCPEILHISSTIYERVLGRGESVMLEDQVLSITRHGVTEEAYFTLAYSPVRDDDGAINGMILTATETTARVVAERERDWLVGQVEVERARLAEVFGQSPAYLAVLRGPRHVFEFANERYLKLVGRRDIVNKPLAEALPEVGRQEIIDILDRVYRTGEAHEGTDVTTVLRRGRERESEERHIDFVFQPMRNASGIVDGILIHGVDVTERHRAEVACIESERRYPTLVNAGSHVVYRMSADWTEMRQLDGQGFISDTAGPSTAWVDQYIYPDDQPHVLAAIREAVRTKSVFELEHRVRRVDGTLGWTRSRAVPVLDDRGEIVEWIGAANDVTARRRTEDALRASEERLQRMVNVEGVGVLTFEAATGTLIDANDAFLKMTGYTRQEVFARQLTWRTMTPPEYVEASVGQMEQFAKTGRIGPYEKEYFRKDGSRSWMVFAGASLGDGTVVKYCIDISARKRAEAALRESEERFRTLADNIAQFAWMADERGSIFWYNRRWFDYTGTTLENMRGWGWTKVHHPDHVRRVVEKISHSFETGEEWEDTFPLRGKDGGYRWFLSRAIPIRDESGRVVRWFGTNTDTTEQRQTAEELRRANERVNGILESITDGFIGIDREWRLTYINSTAERFLGHRREELLDVSRVITGKLRLNRQPTHLHQIVRHVLETVGEELHDKHLQIETDLAARHDLVDADPARLQQVLWNLLKIAGKFTPAGGYISIRTRDEAAGHVAIEVRDTGKGIPADVLPHVFDAFEQGADEVTRQHGGLGLGLAIVKAVVDRHGGTIRADSGGDGKGATFTVTLPLLARGEAAAPAPVTEKPDAAGRRRHARLLLVEDHVDTAKLLARLLRSRGFDVRNAYSVAEALKSASSESFDVVVSDLGLPDGSGLDVMRELSRRKSPVVGIAMSGYGMDEDVRASRDAGFVEHLTKPVDLASLEAAIRRVSARVE